MLKRLLISGANLNAVSLLLIAPSYTHIYSMSLETYSSTCLELLYLPARLSSHLKCTSSSYSKCVHGHKMYLSLSWLCALLCHGVVMLGIESRVVLSCWE